ncbi:uncharacterized protein LOC134266939 isoform X1 [Saccostrea cucullata]|uniref:uncharacterized protein LOC134266939 isoform X1 n=1 Tax=Saccostrea cuccullata TaxID=36930 RepID=UPI002ED307FE
MKSKVLEICEVESRTDAFKFDKALSAMEGTYTKLCVTEYTFVHDSVFEIVAYHFGCQFPDLILQYSSSSFIANKLKLQEQGKHESKEENERNSENDSLIDESEHKDGNVTFSGENNDHTDICIWLKEDHVPMLAKRLYRDIENMELYDVFMNDALKQPNLCQAFIEVLKTKSYSELKSLFLSKQEDVPKVVSQQNRARTKHEGWRMEWQDVLVNKRSGKYSVRVISWVVFYGHNQILQHILKQTELNKETESELFWNPFHEKFKQFKNNMEKKVEKDSSGLLYAGNDPRGQMDKINELSFDYSEIKSERYR